MLGARTTRSGRALVTIVTGAILWASIVTVAFAADKTFSASVSPVPLVAGASYGEGARAASKITLTIVNESNQAQLGSANVTAPAGITVTAATSNVGTASLVAGVIQLRNLNLAPAGNVAVSISARVECGANHASYTWQFAVKQANDFNGTGNDLAQVGSTTNTVTGNCGIVFSKQPKASEKDPTPITNAIYNPAGDPVTVTVKDGAGLDTVAWWSGTVALAIGDDPSLGVAAIGGTSSGSVSGGSVALAPTINKAASGYSLLATASPAAGASSGTSNAAVESDNFNIVDDANACVSSTTKCQSHSQGPKTDVVVEAGTGGAAGDVVILSLNDPSVTAPNCGGGYVVSSELVVLNVTTSDGVTPSSRPKTATLTMAAQFVTQSASKYQVCYQGATGPAAFLAACANKNPVLPCILSKTIDKFKNLVIVVAAPGGDPKMNF
jgi:hypothetical protein